MELNLVVNAQKISEEPVTCIAVKEDRRENIMSSVALMKGVEGPWTGERVVRFIDLLGYGGLTLNGDTEVAIMAFRNRVVEMRKADVTTENGVKGDKPSSSRTQWCCYVESSEQSDVTLKTAHKKDSVQTRQSCICWKNTRAASYPVVRKVATGEHKKASQEFVHLARRDWRGRFQLTQHVRQRRRSRYSELQEAIEFMSAKQSRLLAKLERKQKLLCGGRPGLGRQDLGGGHRAARDQ